MLYCQTFTINFGICNLQLNSHAWSTSPKKLYNKSLLYLVLLLVLLQSQPKVVNVAMQNLFSLFNSWAVINILSLNPTHTHAIQFLILNKDSIQLINLPELISIKLTPA